MNNLRYIDSQILSEEQYAPAKYGGYGYPQEKEDSLDFRSLWRFLMSYKWSIFFITLITFIIVVVVSLSLTPSYRAFGTIQIQREEVDNVTDHKIKAQQEKIAAKDFYQTQYELLRSKTLAGRVIDKLDIRDKNIKDSTQNDHKTSKPLFSDVVSNVKLWLLEIKKSLEQIIGITFSFSNTQVNLGKISQESLFLQNLKIIPLKNSQIVTIQYDHSDPEMASKIANNIASEFIAMSMERRSTDAIGTKNTLKEMLDITKKELDKKELALTAYAKKHSLVTTGNNEALVDKRLDELILAVTLAENKRIEIESRLKNQSFGGNQSTINPSLDNNVISTLKVLKAQKSVEYQNNLKTYKPAHPNMRSLNRQIQNIQKNINLEQKRINQAVKTEKNIKERSLKNALYAAKAKEQALIKKLNAQKNKSFTLQDKKINYNSLEKEAENTRKSYQGLLARKKEVEIASIGGKNNISIVDKAEIPHEQFKPNLKINLPLGIIVGLFLGIALSFLRNMFNDTVKSSEEIEQFSGLPILGTIPKIKNRKTETQALLTFNNPQSAIAEACRSLRTTLLFSTDGDPKVLLITSPMPNEGKTTTAVNLASAFVQAGKKVLLIDADLRKPSLHTRLKLNNKIGLASCLIGECDPEKAIHPRVLGNLSVLTAGTVLNNPMGLFSSEKMADLLKDLSLIYDNIILDAPPVMGLADSLVLAHVSSATLMVASHRQTNRKGLSIACNKIRNSKGNLIGCIYTKVGTYDDDASQDLYAYGNRGNYGLVS